MSVMAAANKLSGPGAKRPMRPGRRLLLWALAFVALFVVSFFFAEPLFRFLVQPIADAFVAQGTSGERVKFTALTEVFFIYVKAAFFATLFLSTPLVLADLWRAQAVRSGRYEHRAALYGASALVLSFFAGGVLIYTVVFPKLAAFYLSFQVPSAVPIQMEFMVAENLALLMRMMFFTGLACMLPAGLALLAGVGRRRTVPVPGGPSSDRFE